MKGKALFLIMILVLSGLLAGCGGQSADHTAGPQPRDTSSEAIESTAPDALTSSGQEKKEEASGGNAEGNTEVTAEENTEGNTEDSTERNTEETTEDAWKPEGTLLRCSQGDMIYIPNEGPVIMEGLSDEQRALIESLQTGDVIRVTIETVEESYPGHCSPETVEFAAHGDYKHVIPVIDDLRELGWKITLPVPPIEEVADSHLSPLEDQLHYYTIEELRAVWGDPKSTMSGGDNGWSVDIWQIGSGEDMLQVDVQYDTEGNIIGGYTYRTADQPTIW